MNLYVGNLAIGVTQDDLRRLFGEFGTVDSVRIITDRIYNISKGFAFVEMPVNSEAERAMSKLNRTGFRGKIIEVSVARPRE